MIFRKIWKRGGVESKFLHNCNILISFFQSWPHVDKEVTFSSFRGPVKELFHVFPRIVVINTKRINAREKGRTLGGQGRWKWERNMIPDTQLSPVRIRHNAKISNNLRSISPKLPRGRGVSKRKRRNPKNLAERDRSWTRTVAESRGLKKTKKGREREKRRKGKIEEGRLRKIASFTALSHLPSLWSFFSFEKIFSQANLFPMVSVARENTRRYLVSCIPSLDEIGFRWPPNVFRYSFLIGSPLDRVTFFRKRLPSSLLSSFLSFFRSVFEQKRRQVRRHFSTDRPSLLFPFSFSRHFTLSRHLHEVVLRRREVNKGEAREGGGWRVLPGWRSLKTFSAQLGWKASATFASSLFFPSSSNLSPSRVTLISFLDALLLLLGREKEGEASAKRRSVPSHSWRNDGEEGLATMEDRFKLERGVATSRRRGSPPSKHAPSPSFLPLPLPEQTGWRGLHEQERDAGNYLPRWNDGGPEFRRSEVTAYVLTPWRRERAENTRESCWPFVGTSWKTRRYTTNSIRANVLIAEFAAPIVEKLRQCGPRGIVLSLSL